MLLPTQKTALRRHLDQWFASEDIHPNIVAEFDDSALMKSFGVAGDGTFPAPTVVETDLLSKNLVNFGTI